DSREIPLAVVQGLLQSAVGFGEPRASAALLGLLTRPESGRYRPEQFAALAGWLDALDQRNTPLEQIAKKADGTLRADLKRLDAIFAEARKLVRDSKAPLPERSQAVRLLGR